jgi:hypothetical protein
MYLLLSLTSKNGKEELALAGRTNRSAGGLNGLRQNGRVGDLPQRWTDLVLRSDEEGNAVVEACLELRYENGYNIF